ncbi:MAG: DUF6512 family protein [Clostridium perfringens]|nr:DUF6512 family protein [Clostridium perfringens]
MNFLLEKQWIYIGIPILFVAGAFMHYFYYLSRKNILVGLISPVNESVWEHLKLIFFPMVLWWSVYFIVRGKELGIDSNRWFTAGLVSLIVSMIGIVFLYYFYTGAFGKKSVVVDIVILLIALFVGQTLSFHIYKHFEGIHIYTVSFIVAIIFFVLALCTFKPPHIPLFQENKTGVYGIRRK